MDILLIHNLFPRLWITCGKPPVAPYLSVLSVLGYDYEEFKKIPNFWEIYLTLGRYLLYSRTNDNERLEMETFLAYECDAGTLDTYWEIYTDNTKTYLFTIEADDFGDFLARYKDKDVIVFPQEPYQVMFSLHIELDKWFGQPDRHLDDCESIFDPQKPLDDFWCQGCSSFLKWTDGKFPGDYYNIGRKRHAEYA